MLQSKKPKGNKPLCISYLKNHITSLFLPLLLPTVKKLLGRKPTHVVLYNFILVCFLLQSCLLRDISKTRQACIRVYLATFSISVFI